MLYKGILCTYLCNEYCFNYLNYKHIADEAKMKLKEFDQWLTS